MVDLVFRDLGRSFEDGEDETSVLKFAYMNIKRQNEREMEQLQNRMG